MRPTPLPLLLLLLLRAGPASASSLEVRVEDPKGRPVAEAVVAAIPRSGLPVAAAAAAPAVIDQVDKQFVPHLIAVAAGTAVSFPNSDDIRHHVYSFSEPKKFELPLYKGTPTDPLVFDQPGLVVLGCNIHDWMVAYLYVLETPFYAVTDEAGMARVQPLPPGTYDVVVRHPRAREEPPAVTAQVAGDAPAGPLTFTLRLKADFRRSAAPRAGGKEY